MSSTTTAVSRNRAQLAYGTIALFAWFSLTLNFIITALGVYPSMTTNPTLLGMGNPEGIAGAIGRLLDFFSYFTIWSNITVAVIFTMLFRNPDRRSPVFRTLFLSSMVMITVTGIIYGVVLAGAAKLQGLEYITNAIEHYIVPILVFVVFIVWGPRRLLRFATVFSALILPISWAVLVVLIRGPIIGAYPYGFVDIADHGLGSVLLNIFGVAIVGVLLGLAFLLIDRVRSRTA